MTRGDAHEPFGPWLVVTDTGLAVGGVGFHGEPDDRGRAEIGYGVAVSFRGRGIDPEDRAPADG
jgi:RimJ/RimL family protein N-acetyltransferase